MASIWAEAIGVNLDRKWLYAQVGPSTETEWEEAILAAHKTMRAHGRNLAFAEEGAGR